MLSEGTATRTASMRLLPLVLLLFVGSGAAALIYEIVWFRLVELVIGSTAMSLAVVLGTFMGGMCVGSLVVPRVISEGRHPLRVYAALELGTAVLAAAVLYGVPLTAGFYAAIDAPGFPGILLRGAFSAALLFPPTVLMGATLPAVARWVDATPRGISWLGLFYGGNIAGAVLGCIAAGFYLLPVHDVAVATGAAMAINFVVAFVAWWVAARVPYRHVVPAPPTNAASRRPAARVIHVAIGLSGFAALGAEVVWTRVLSLTLGPTVYTFSIILAVVLLGLGIGGSAGALIARVQVRPRVAFGICQLLLVTAIAWTAHALTGTLPHWPVYPSVDTMPAVRFARDFARSAYALLPATMLWGASFPLALFAASSSGRDQGRVVGGVYAANTLGAIAGAVIFSLMLIPAIGTQQAERVLIGVSLLAAMLLLGASDSPAAAPHVAAHDRNQGRSTAVRLTWLGAAMALASLLALGVPPVPPELVAFGRFAFAQAAPSRMLYVGEGSNASVAVSESADGVRTFHVAGKIEASTDPQDMRLQRMLAHYAALVHPHPRSVLVVGFGAGITAGTFLMYPGVERVVICEIEPLIPPHIGPLFSRENLDVLHDPRVEIVYDDARHYVSTTHETFDIITSDPIHPWVKGSAALYSREYFDLVRRRLNPGGVVTQWVPLYETNEAAVRSELATFLDVFHGATLWGSRTGTGGGYDLIALAQDGATTIDVEALLQRIRRPEQLPVVRSLVTGGFGSPLDLFSTYVGDGASMAPALRGAQLNLDRNFRVQYLAGISPNAREHERIYRDLVSHRVFPTGLFVAPEVWQDSLREVLARRR